MVSNSRLQPTIYRCVESLVSTTANANNGIEQNSFSKSVYVSPLSRTGEFLTDSVKTLMQWYLSSRKIWVQDIAMPFSVVQTINRGPHTLPEKKLPLISDMRIYRRFGSSYL